MFSREGVALAVPTAEEQDYIHDKYLNELIPGKFLPQTRERLLAIAARMRDEDGIQALILGGTELPLILTDNSLARNSFFGYDADPCQCDSGSGHAVS